MRSNSLLLGTKTPVTKLYGVGEKRAESLARAGIYTALIRNKTPLDEINFDVMKLSPTLFAYSEKSRRKMLGGVV